MESGGSSPGIRPVIEFADFRLDLQQRKLSTLDGAPLALNSRAFDTLLALVERRGEVVSKHRLMDVVWPKAVVEENNLNQAISALRKTLGDSDTNRIILTVPGRGFCFVAEIRNVTDRTASRCLDNLAAETINRAVIPPSALDKSKLESPGLLDLETPQRSQPIPDFANSRRSFLGFLWKRNAVVASVALILVVVALAAWIRTPARASIPRLAILIFENQSPDPANAFFAEGLHSEILSTLANRVSGLQVISRTTMEMYRDSGKSLQTIADELNATHILEGSVFREGNRMRLTLQLIDGRTDGLLWSERYERTLKDALPLQAEVAGTVAGQLVPEFVGMFDAPTNDALAYDLYLKARIARMTMVGSTPLEEWRRAETLLDEALSRDPGFWRAYLERARIRIYTSRIYPGTEGAQLAAADLATARQIAGDEPIVLAVAAEVESDPERALQLFEAAEARGPVEPELLWPKSMSLMFLHRWPEALANWEYLAQVDGGNTAGITIAWFYFMFAREAELAYQLISDLYNREPERFEWRMLRAQTIFSFTGDSDEWQALSFANDLEFLDAGTQSFEIWKQLRFTGKFRELKTYFDGLAVEAQRNLGFSQFIVFNIRETPTAEFRGWSDLFLGDAAGAIGDGQAILEYVAGREATPADAWYVHLLNAEGLLFIGDKARAVAEVNVALELAAATDRDVAVAAARAQGAAILAWAGEEDEAVNLLETLADSVPGLPPAQITRDPLFYIPLATHPRYRVLHDRLEAEMATMTFE